MSETVTSRPGRRPALPAWLVLPAILQGPLAAGALAFVVVFLAQQFGVALTGPGLTAGVVVGAMVAGGAAVQFAGRRAKR